MKKNIYRSHFGLTENSVFCSGTDDNTMWGESCLKYVSDMSKWLSCLGVQTSTPDYSPKLPLRGPRRCGFRCAEDYNIECVVFHRMRRPLPSIPEE